MNEAHKKEIKKLRAEGLSYGAISETIGVSVNTVKSYCKRHKLGGIVVDMGKPRLDIDKDICQCCGAKLQQAIGRKVKRFCSNRCRNMWWNANLDKVKRMANYDFVCAYCKKQFTSYGNKGRKYCCHECYIADRFGGDK